LNKLNADELGEKGQARFKELCADAKLVCNQSDRDRRGWDFIVEFPFETNPSDIAPLQSRKTPTSCHVQVKTIEEDTKQFRMRLSSAEWLAKELKPSFVYILRVNAKLEFTEAFLVHILDAPLATILARLRKEDASKNKTPINKKYIVMRMARVGKKLAPTGEILRDALASECGPDLHAYAAKKKAQLETLGFDERPYKLKMTLHAESVEELVDLFLGKKELRATNTSSSQERFGIDLPLFDPQDATISITPNAIDTCKIVVRSDPTSTPALFSGKVYYPKIPNLPREHLRILIETDLFEIQLRDNGLSISTKHPIGPLTPSDWANYWRMGLAFANGKGSMEISSDTYSTRSMIEVNKKVVQLDPTDCAEYIAFSERAAQLLKLAGIINEPTVALDELWANRRGIDAVWHLSRNEKLSTPLGWTLDKSEQLEQLSDIEMIYVDNAAIGKVTIGYAGFASFRVDSLTDQTSLSTDDISVVRISILASPQEDYQKLIDDVRVEKACNNVIAIPLRQGSQPEPTHDQVEQVGADSLSTPST
jgi:hypothetical protein